MGVPVFTRDEYLVSLKNLMPRGGAWPTNDPDSAQSRTLKGLAPTYERISQRAADVVAESFPPTATEMLPEWEAALGLPDPCAGPAPTLQARRNQVNARLFEVRDPSIPDIIAFAAALGFTITITEDVASAYHWTVNAPSSTVTYFRVDSSTVGEPLESSGNDVLECEILAINPGHLTVDFNYI